MAVVGNASQTELLFNFQTNFELVCFVAGSLFSL
jgi:hypothetical protein